MSYKSGHIYLVDKEPTNEELANFSKPVQFDICKDGLFYSILYDKNGNRYVEDRSKITTGFIKLGTIVRVGNVINIGVHPSGFNHWRINGVDVTSSNPVVLELEPETVLYRIDSIVGNSAGGIFIFQGEADKNPLPTNSLNYPNYAFFKDVLITPNSGGSIDPEILNNYVAKEEEDWTTFETGTSSNFSINYDGISSRFKITSGIDVPKTLNSIIFEQVTDRALEIWIYNAMNLNISIPNSTTAGLSKGFTTAQSPFIILPKTYAKLKYNPQTDLIECWKVNATSGSSFPTTGNNGDILEKDSTAQSGAKWVDRLGGLTANLLSLWNGSKFINSIISQVSGKIGINNTSPAETLDVNGRVKTNALILPNNANTAIANRLRSDGSRLYYANNSAVESTVAYTSDLDGKVDKPTTAITSSDTTYKRIIIIDSSGNTKYFDLSGTKERIMSVTATGQPKAEIVIEEEFETDADLINAVKSASYSSSPIATISVSGKTLKKGKVIVDTDGGWIYKAFQDNTVIRK